VRCGSLIAGMMAPATQRMLQTLLRLIFSRIINPQRPRAVLEPLGHRCRTPRAVPARPRLEVRGSPRTPTVPARFLPTRIPGAHPHPIRRRRTLRCAWCSASPPDLSGPFRGEGKGWICSSWKPQLIRDPASHFSGVTLPRSVQVSSDVILLSTRVWGLGDLSSPYKAFLEMVLIFVLMGKYWVNC